MQSMKSPQGSTDPRVTMTDSPVGGLLSPSFASVLAFDEPDDPAYQNLQGLEEEDHGKHNAGLHDSVGSISSGIQEKVLRGLKEEDIGKHHTGLHESVGSSSSGMQENVPDHSEATEKQQLHFPRLELDAAMDEYHALDGPADFNPQNNTPVSNSGGNSPAIGSHDRQRYKTENIRTSSAPQASAVKLDWLEDYGQIDREEGENNKTASPKRRLSASDQPQSASSSPNKSAKNDPLPLPTPPAVKFEAGQSFERYVRFSPNDPSQYMSHSPHRPLPSVERKQDYISLHRLKKQQEKWRGRSQREQISPRRSPTKIQPSTLNRQPDIHFLAIPRIPPSDTRRATRSQGNLSTSDQIIETAGQEAPAHEEPGRVYDLVILNLGLYRSQYTQGSRWAFWRVRMCPTFIPARSLTEDAQDTRHIVYRLPAEDLILHFVLVVPYFLVRIPFVTLAKAGRLANSRAGISFLDVVRIIWAFVTAFINLALRKVCGMEFGFYGKVQTEYSDRSQTPPRPN